MTSPPSKRDKDRKAKAKNKHARHYRVDNLGRARARGRLSGVENSDGEATAIPLEKADMRAASSHASNRKAKAEPKSPHQIYNEAIQSVWTESGKAE